MERDSRREAGGAAEFPPVTGTNMNTQIVAVVVLYKRKPERSETINSLATVFKRNPELLRSIRVLIWDNSPTAIDPLYLPFACDYKHAGRNVGTSGAYNNAMEFADAQGSPWLLLLDQDTTLSDEFLPRMLEYSHRLLDSPEVGSVVPFHLFARAPRLTAIASQFQPKPANSTHPEWRLQEKGICRK